MDDIVKDYVKNETKFLKSIDAVHNENDAYVYTSQSGADHINLAFILLEYKVWLIENKLIK